MSAHAAKTFIGDRVLYHRANCPDPHVASVIRVHSDHCADLVYYCPQRHAWFEATSIEFGKRDGDFFCNPEG